MGDKKMKKTTKYQMFAIAIISLILGIIWTVFSIVSISMSSVGPRSDEMPLELFIFALPVALPVMTVMMGYFNIIDMSPPIIIAIGFLISVTIMIILVSIVAKIIGFIYSKRR